MTTKRSLRVVRLGKPVNPIARVLDLPPQTNALLMVLEIPPSSNAILLLLRQVVPKEKIVIRNAFVRSRLRASAVSLMG